MIETTNQNMMTHIGYNIFTFAVNDYLTSIHAYYTQAVFNGKGRQFFSPAASGSAGEVSDNKQNTS